jgi:hypothetical protein
MQSPQTLHDFVLNLLNDPSSLTEFASDPQSSLSAAGLGGLDASDVHDIIPLVIDYAPTHLVDALQSAQNTLSLGGLDAGQAGAIQQLQVLAQSVGSVATSVPSADPVSAVTDALHDGLTTAPVVTGLGGAEGLGQVTGALTGVTDLGNGSGVDLSNLGGLAGEAGHLGSSIGSVGNLGNIGDLGSVDHLANLDGLGDLGSVGNVTGDLGNIGNGDLGSVGNIGNLGLDHVGDLGGVGNLVNVGNLGNLVNVGNAVTVDNLGGGNSVSDLAAHNPVSGLLPGAASTTISSVTSHLTSTDALHSLTGGLQSDVTNTTSHSPVADGVSGNAVSGTVDHVQGDLGLGSLTHNLLPTDDAHPLF